MNDLPADTDWVTSDLSALMLVGTTHFKCLLALLKREPTPTRFPQADKFVTVLPEDEVTDHQAYRYIHTCAFGPRSLTRTCFEGGGGGVGVVRHALTQGQ